MRKLERRLDSISTEISSVHEELAVLAEQLEFQRDVVEETRVRALVTESPLADRELRVATQDFERIERVIEDARRRLELLGRERERLLAGPWE